MKSIIIFMSSLILTVQGMESFKKYTYDGTFYQMAAKAPCFLTYIEEDAETEMEESSPSKFINWHRYTINPKENSCIPKYCFSMKYFLSDPKDDATCISALSSSGRYAIGAAQGNMYIIDIDNNNSTPVEGYESIDSVHAFCADDYLVQDSFKDEKHTIDIWAINGKKCASIPNLQLAGSYVSALGYCMLHDQKQFIAWQKIGERSQRNFLISCANGNAVKQWYSSFYDVVIHEQNQIIAGDSDENTLDICSLSEINQEWPKKLGTVVIPDKKDLIRCWCFNDSGDALIIGTEKGMLYIANWLQDKKISFSMNNQDMYNPEQITSISTIWSPSVNICCLDHCLSSIYCFDPQAVITAGTSHKFLNLSISHDSNDNNTDVNPDLMQ